MGGCVWLEIEGVMGGEGEGEEREMKGRLEDSRRGGSG